MQKDDCNNNYGGEKSEINENFTNSVNNNFEIKSNLFMA